MKYNSLGDRMKGYENISRIYLTKRSPVIIRIDGKAFHSFTKGFLRPFDNILMETMAETAKFLAQNISGCKLAYTQSDEISLLLTDYETNETQPWFENNLQKLVSVSASMATLHFNRIFANKVISAERSKNHLLYKEICEELTENDISELTDYCNALQKSRSIGAMFDARAFVLPREEVVNYFIWRQQDATRNSILMVAHSFFSQREMQGIKCDALQDKLFTERNINWNDYSVPQKRGTCIKKQLTRRNDVERREWVVDEDIPIQDYKSKSSFKNKREQAEYARQLYLYALFVKKKYGRYPDILRFMMFRKNMSIDIPFNESDLNEALSWARETVKEIRECWDFTPTCDEFFSENLCNHREYCESKI